MTALLNVGEGRAVWESDIKSTVATVSTDCIFKETLVLVENI